MRCSSGSRHVVELDELTQVGENVLGRVVILRSLFVLLLLLLLLLHRVASEYLNAKEVAVVVVVATIGHCNGQH